MRTFLVPSKARQTLWVVLSAGAPVIVLSAVVLVPVLAGAACSPGASEASQVTSSPRPNATGGSPVRVSRLLGSAVFGLDCKLVGTVNDVLLDQGGTITAITLDIGAFLGVHTRTVVVSINRLRLVSATEVATSVVPGPSFASGADDEGSATIMENLMSGRERAWQVGASTTSK
jgi:sporulation protein YlmC with PRC-barrel domain